MMTSLLSRLAISFALVVGLGVAPVVAEEGGAAARAPVITHSPATMAIRGQPLTLKAKVTKGDGKIESVTLYYALFRDAAPFRVPMRATGLDLYIGTIEPGLLTGVDSISYYIEAQDSLGMIAETPWHTVTFKTPDSTVPAEPPPPAPAPPISAPQEKSSAVSKGLIAGGAAAVLAGAYFLANDDGGGGGGSVTNPPAQAGTYAGSVTTCFALSGEAPTCESHAMSIIIDSRGVVFSETLRQGQQLTGNLSGNDFTLVAAINQPTGTTGEIVYNGTVLPGRIVGSITGSAQTPGGIGTYSGSFSAARQ